jgi:hypothetical protein
MRRCLLLLTLLLLLAACGDDSGGVSTEEPGTTGLGTLPEGAVVFTPEDAATDIYGDETTWTPGPADVEVAETALRAHLDDNADLGLDDLDTYHRQYVGVGDEDVVSVNALCEGADLDDWEDELILVNDGGTCFWQAQVDLTDGSIGAFTVNGVA